MRKRSILQWRVSVDLFFASGFAAVCVLEIKSGRWGGVILGLFFAAGFTLDWWHAIKQLKVSG